jgi:hypothetical protein
MGTQLRTEFAMKAVDMAELFKVLVGQTPVTAATAGEAGYQAELSAPDGMSTGGGTQAVQHIKLVSPSGGATIVAGAANQVDRTAELRTYEHLAELHAQRYRGAALPIDRASYGELLERAQDFFPDKGLRVVLIDAARRPAPAAPSKPAGGGAGMLLLFLGVISLIGGAVFFFLGRK